MNILPKKRWHVRTKENISRVRRDEAQAAAVEKELQRRALLAEQEARTSALREKARSKLEGNVTGEHDEVQEGVKYKHVNLFEDIEDGKIVTNETNAEYEREQKEEKEKYEKQIGYLTYLGQDTVEATGKISWYNKVPDRLSSVTESVEVGSKNKSLADPLSLMRKYLPSSEWNNIHNVKSATPEHTATKPEKMNFIKIENRNAKKCKKHKEKKRLSFKHNKKCKRRRNYSSGSGDDSDGSLDKHFSRRRCKSRKCEKKSSTSSSESIDSSSSSDSCEGTPKRRKVDLEQLRAERLKREKEEQLRTQVLLAAIRGEPPPPAQADKTNHVPTVKQKYNSQFNPELARQNFCNAPL
ncbi:hypothetical protein PR048_010576 [Dryococelus australis]|uniref:CBF1-interacting co-repressor CIR N-terminal domain-containing protein n=1 Tax=Dryococelus australis TaxID=614101 RepID=A0ABQ9I3K2_9NEOP|nr:hypothetical protein PR048_010576 [Dryococelus australis]